MGATEIHLESRVDTIAYSDGTVYSGYVMSVELWCKFDVSKFPYDQHNCKIDVASWNFPDSILKIG